MRGGGGGGFFGAGVSCHLQEHFGKKDEKDLSKPAWHEGAASVADLLSRGHGYQLYSELDEPSKQ